MPTPRPLTLVTWAAVEKPGRKINCSRSRSPSCAARSGESNPRSMALLRIFSARDAGAVVGDLDDHVAAFLRGPQLSVPSGSLPAAWRTAGGSMP